MRYRLIECLGVGGMAEVWRGYDQVLDRPVAIKFGEGLRSEALAEANISHPNIVQVHDFGAWDDGRPFVVMELLEGQTLGTVLNGGFTMPWRRAVTVCADVAAALAAAHARGIVHRDVSATNVMLTPTGAKLLDFGISALVGEPEPQRDSGGLHGTPAYVAPERLRGGAVTPAADVYALGVLFYRALAGRLPWPARTQAELLEAHLWLDPAALPRIPGLPEEIAGLCMRCLAKVPGERPSAGEIAGMLGRIGRVPVMFRSVTRAPPAPETTVIDRASTMMPTADMKRMPVLGNFAPGPQSGGKRKGKG